MPAVGRTHRQFSLPPSDPPQIPPPHLLLTPRRTRPGPGKPDQGSKCVGPRRTYSTHLSLHEDPGRLAPPTGPTPSGFAPGPSSARRSLCLPGGNDARAARALIGERRPGSEACVSQPTAVAAGRSGFPGLGLDLLADLLERLSGDAARPHSTRSLTRSACRPDGSPRVL